MSRFVISRLRMMLAGLGAASALALLPAVAGADPYVVDHCRNWDTDAGGVAFGLVKGANADNCGRPAGDGAVSVIVPSASMAPGSDVNIELSVPADRPNIHIERVQTYYYGPVSGGGTAQLILWNHLGQQISAEVLPAAPVVDTTLPPGARSLRWNTHCTEISGQPCGFASTSVLIVAKSRLYLDEGVNPTLTVTGGSLVGPGAKAGQQNVSFDAGDTDSGVSSVTVSLGSTVVGTVKYACNVHDWSPCKRDETSQVLQVDATKVPDGDHDLVVAVRDAADNVLTRSLGTITVANGPGAGSPNGASASRLAKLSAGFATTRKSTKHLSFRSRPTTRGRLVDEQGRPIAGATVAVLQRPRRAGAVPVQIATVSTQPDGSFSYRLPGGPSRAITFAYTAFSGDAKPATSSSLRTVVRAVVAAQIRPRSVRPGRPVTMSGRLRLLGREGVEIKIQARDGSRWRTIDDVRTTRGGTFRWTYRFKASGRGRTFGFRARVASPIYPFAAGNSKAMFVRVR